MITEHDVPYESGTVRVREYAGDGPAVIMIHGAGFCAPCWDPVVEHLDGRLHGYAIDLPGHGASTAKMRRASDAWRAVIAVTEHLGLASPLLAGLGQGSHAALCATIESRGSYAGVITFGGSCVRSRTSAEDDIAFYTSDQFKDVLARRFYFGSRGVGEEEARHLLDKMAARLPSDWRVIGFKGMLEEAKYSMRPFTGEEGGWINLPTPDTIITMLSVQVGDRLYPDESLYRHLDVPVLIVQLTEGLDQAHAERERQMARTNDLVDLRVLDAGEYPHYTRSDEMAHILLETCGVSRRWDVRPVQDG